MVHKSDLCTTSLAWSFLGVLGLHVHDEVDHAVGVAELVVVPGDQLDKGRAQLDPRL
jgi:hypothetical protein